jgi:uncharacterized membrane protein
MNTLESRYPRMTQTVKVIIGVPIMATMLVWLLGVHLSGATKTGVVIFGTIWLLGIVIPALLHSQQRYGYQKAIEDFADEIMSQQALSGALPQDLQRAFDNWAVRSARIGLAQKEGPRATRH